jgi:hypothetical protein
MSFRLRRVSSTAGMSAEREFRRARVSRRRSIAARVFLAAAAVVVGVASLDRGWAARHPAMGLALLLGAGLVSWMSAVSVLRSARSDPRRWARGAAGERRTAEILSDLPRRRWGVLHDLALPASRANVDHLVIGPTGVWLVDTKTTREEVGVGWRSVRLGDRRIDPGPTAWEASTVACVLGAEVRPVIALHSPRPPRLRRRGRRIGQRVRVVAAGDLPTYLRRGRQRLSGRDVQRLLEVAQGELGPRLRGGGRAGSVV